MAIKSKTILKGYFQTGNKPTQGQFADLIDTLYPLVVNVLDYGAVRDGATDNTAAFSNAIYDLIVGGGGVLFIPYGVYYGRIIIPGIPGSQWCLIEIVAQSAPPPIFGTIGTFTMPTRGTIIQCNGTAEGIIYASPYASGFSSVHVVVRNIETRSYSNPNIGGINLFYASQHRVENCFINAGIYNPEGLQPTNTAVAGFTSSALNNGALSVVKNTVVVNHYNGFVANEHFDGDGLVVASCVNGVNMQASYHSININRLGSYRNTHDVTVSGACAFAIQQLNIEYPGSGQVVIGQTDWQASAYNVNDAGNLARGDINWWTTEGGSGTHGVFTKNGGTGVKCRQIGA